MSLKWSHGDKETIKNSNSATNIGTDVRKYWPISVLVLFFIYLFFLTETQNLQIETENKNKIRSNKITRFFFGGGEYAIGFPLFWRCSFVFLFAVRGGTGAWFSKATCCLFNYFFLLNTRDEMICNRLLPSHYNSTIYEWKFLRQTTNHTVQVIEIL